MSDFKKLKLDYQLCFPLYACAREIVKSYRPFLDPLGITYTQYITLMVLWEEESISVKALGEKLHLDSGTLTPLLKKLEHKGYIFRERSKEDERIVLARITEKGMKLREQAAIVPEEMGECLHGFSKTEIESMRSLLYRLMDVLEKS